VALAVFRSFKSPKRHRSPRRKALVLRDCAVTIRVRTLLQTTQTPTAAPSLYKAGSLGPGSPTPCCGHLRFNDDGDLVYTPDPIRMAQRKFQLRIADGRGHIGRRRKRRLISFRADEDPNAAAR